MLDLRTPQSLWSLLYHTTVHTRKVTQVVSGGRLWHDHAEWTTYNNNNTFCVKKSVLGPPANLPISVCLVFLWASNTFIKGIINNFRVVSLHGLYLTQGEPTQDNFCPLMKQLVQKLLSRRIRMRFFFFCNFTKFIIVV